MFSSAGNCGAGVVLSDDESVIETPDGKRIRVRVGPFDGKAEAEKAAARIKGLNLPVSILLL